MSRWTDAILVALFERFPPKTLIFKDPEPRPAIEYASEVSQPFARWFSIAPDDFMRGKDVIDVGFGFGGRPARFMEVGARSVSGVEVDMTHVDTARAFAAENTVEFDARLGYGEDLPFADESFDLVTMFDVMEHVLRPGEVLSECFRVLRPGGHLALVFPPYYHMTAGSHLAGYATSLPGLNLLFSTRALRSATQKYLDQRPHAWREFLRDVPTDKLWNQNGLTVRGFRRLVSGSAWEVIMFRYIGTRDHRLSPKAWYKKLLLMPLFLVFEGLARLPVVQEACCHRLAAILAKPSRA